MSYLEDGFSTTIGFAADATVEIKEMSLKPPGAEGGDSIKTSSMLNTLYHTKAPRSLIDISDGSGVFQYDTIAQPKIIALVNVNNLITWTFPDGGTLACWGYLKSWEPSELQEGELPTAAVVIVITNVNDSGVETGPVETSPV